jgi:hypothetical protein
VRLRHVVAGHRTASRKLIFPCHDEFCSEPDNIRSDQREAQSQESVKVLPHSFLTARAGSTAAALIAG